MHAVDLLEQAIVLAESIGLQVRHEWLGERTGGLCRIGKRSVLFVDLSLTAEEQLSQVIEGLRCCPPAAERLAEAIETSADTADTGDTAEGSPQRSTVLRALFRLIQVPVAG